MSEVKETKELVEKHEGETVNGWNLDKNDSYQKYLSQKPTMQFFDWRTKTKINTNEDLSQTKYDIKNTRIIQGTFNVDQIDAKVVLAHHDTVRPAYFILIQQDTSMDN